MLYIPPFSELFAHSSGNRWSLIEIPDDNSDVKALCKHPCSVNTSEHTREREKQRHRETQRVIYRDREMESDRHRERQTEGQKEKQRQREKETERNDTIGCSCHLGPTLGLRVT